MASALRLTGAYFRTVYGQSKRGFRNIESGPYLLWHSRSTRGRVLRFFHLAFFTVQWKEIMNTIDSESAPELKAVLVRPVFYYCNFIKNF